MTERAYCFPDHAVNLPNRALVFDDSDHYGPWIDLPRHPLPGTRLRVRLPDAVYWSRWLHVRWVMLSRPDLDQPPQRPPPWWLVGLAMATLGVLASSALGALGVY
jgi:hypothetical protein